MPMTAKGVTKLIEECGELQQLLGKRLAYWATDEHPDGSNLRDRMIEEMGDVLGALDFVAMQFGIASEVRLRAATKFLRFVEWDAVADNNVDSIEGRAVASSLPSPGGSEPDELRAVWIAARDFIDRGGDEFAWQELAHAVESYREVYEPPFPGGET